MATRSLSVPALVIVCATAVLLWIWTRFADLWLPSVAFYAGLVVLLTGLLCVLYPLRIVGIGTRKGALLVALAGAALGASALLWPVAAGAHAAGRSTELDSILPNFDRNERHEIRVPGSIDLVRQAVEEVTFADIRGFQTLMSIRARRRVPAPTRRVLATMTAPGAGFTLLAKTKDEFVAGNIGRPWANQHPVVIRDAEEFRSFTVPGYAKIAFNMRVEEAEPGWCKVSTETRVLATDDDARTAFTRYWRVVYPGSALLRVTWLDAIARRLRG